MSTIAERLHRLEERIAAACDRAGRRRDAVTLVAVTKTRSIPEIEEVLAAGVSNIAENFVQEMQAKFEQVSRRASWHFIGHLQRNKAKTAVRMAAWIHSIDSLRLAEEVSRRALELGKRQPVLIEVNVSGEESKFGLAPDDVRALLPELRKLDGLDVRGLMTMAPLVEDPETVRPIFARTRELAEELAALKVPGVQMVELSMGMTSDFEVAIEEGATMIRVGQAIFGPRAE